LAIDPSTPDTLYARTDGGVFKSVDAGTTWSASNFPGFPLFDPVTPSTLYAILASGSGFGSRVFRSIDGGITWQDIGALGLAADAYAILIDPLRPSTLYAATNRGIYKTTNGGAIWNATNAGLDDPDPFVVALAIDPLTPTVLYAATRDTEFFDSTVVYKSTNGGATWNAANAGLTDSSVITLAIDPLTPTTLYAANCQVNDGSCTAFRVSKSTNGGATWNAASEAWSRSRGC
jgi:photosystem II stability/assembly factor-like uncharacterized protein